MNTPTVHQRSPGRWAFVLIVLAGAVLLPLLESLLLGKLAPVGLDRVFLLELSFEPLRFHEISEAIGHEGRMAILDHFPLDFVFIALYAIVGYCLLSLLTTPKPRGLAQLSVVHRVKIMHAYRGVRKAQWVKSLPIVAALCDIGQNIVEILLLDEYLPLNETTTLLLGAVSAAKWVFLVLTVVIALYTWIFRWYNRHVARI